MARRRFFAEALATGPITLDDEQARHARKALRLIPGDPVELFDGAGAVASGSVVETRGELIVEVEQITQVPPAPLSVTIAAAVPKGDRAATLIEKLSELGADCFIPLLTEFSVVDPRPGKVDRFRRIAIESAKQCGRAYLMEVAQPTIFKHLVQRSTQRDPADPGLRLIADVPCSNHENGYRKIENFLHDHSPSDDDRTGKRYQPKAALVLIGPEGGWSESERVLAADAGFTPWQVSDQILRVETAAVAALAILRYLAPARSASL